MSLSSSQAPDRAPTNQVATPRRFKIIYLEITNACNFSCDYCPIDRQTRRKVVMPAKFAERIIDQIAEHNLTDFLTFHLMGEPYLHKDLVHLTKYAEDRDIRVRLLTNGSLLEPERNRALFQAGLSHLEVGFRTPNDTSFSMRLRGNQLTLDDYINRVKDLLETKIRLNARTQLTVKFFIRSRAADLKLADPYEHLTSVEDNLRMAHLFQDFVLDAGRRLGRPIDKWSDVPVRVVDGSYEIYPGIALNWSRIQEFWVQQQRGEMQSYGAVVCGCTAGFRHNFGILASGEVTTCCVDYDGKNVVGDLRKQTLMEVIESPEAKRVKRSFEWFRPPTPFCRTCKGAPTLVASVVKQTNSVLLDVRQRLQAKKSIRTL